MPLRHDRYSRFSTDVSTGPPDPKTPEAIVPRIISWLDGAMTAYRLIGDALTENRLALTQELGRPEAAPRSKVGDAK